MTLIAKFFKYTLLILWLFFLSINAPPHSHASHKTGIHRTNNNLFLSPKKESHSNHQPSFVNNANQDIENKENDKATSNVQRNKDRTALNIPIYKNLFHAVASEKAQNSPRYTKTLLRNLSDFSPNRMDKDGYSPDEASLSYLSNNSWTPFDQQAKKLQLYSENENVSMFTETTSSANSVGFHPRVLKAVKKKHARTIVSGVNSKWTHYYHSPSKRHAKTSSHSPYKGFASPLSSHLGFLSNNDDKSWVTANSFGAGD
ncbi:MAG: hypothetical protein SFT91_02690, partial [Rickettsiaceae bacterium]|nr:hypothetical protein [Rickettsiaceae bacterium]